MDNVTAYPLAWPPHWSRTRKPRRSPFGHHSYQKATEFLLKELSLLGARNVILSTNLHLRLDGLPYSSQRGPGDVGVAVYFQLDNTHQCFPCDKWDKVEHNIYAVAKTIQALRGIQRWGSPAMVAASFQGFKALPHETPRTEAIQWFAECESLSDAKNLFRSLAAQFHPDKAGGSNDAFVELKQQYDQFVLNHT